MEPWIVPQVEKAASASSGLAPFFPASRSQAGGAQSPLDEGVQAGEVGHHLQAGLRDQDVGAVAGSTAARLRQVPRTGGDDDHSPGATG